MATNEKNFRVKNTITTGAGSNNEITYPATDGTDGQVLTTDGSGNLSFADVPDSTGLAVLSTQTVDNPNSFGTSVSDEFGHAVAVSGNYTVVGAPNEDNSSSGTTYSQSGRAYIFDTASGSLLYTLPGPVNEGGANFGATVGVSGKYAAIGSPNVNGIENDTGRIYIYDVTAGTLIHTIEDPNAYSAPNNDYFGTSVAISGKYVIASATFEDDASGTSSGKAYIFDVATGSLLYTLDNPNPMNTSTADKFGNSVSISGNYAIVGAAQEDNSSGSFDSGYAYIYDISSFTTSTISTPTYTLSNPNAYGGIGGFSTDNFGYSVGISGNYAIVSAVGEDDAGGTQSGKAYIYDISTFTTSTVSSATYVLDNPNAYNTSADDNFGQSVAISGNYAIVGASSEDDAGGTDSGKAYIYDISTFTTSTISSANYVLDNPNAYDTSADDNFGRAVAISGNYVVVGALGEDDAGGTSSGKAYIFRTNGQQYSYSTSEIALLSGGIALTDLSVVQNTAAGNGTLVYNNTNGKFSYTPPDLSAYQTSVAFSDLTSTPTTIAGYGITDAFDGAFSSLSGTPTTIAGYGITDAFDGAYSSLTGAPTNVSSFTNDSGYITGYTVTEGDVTAHEAALSITKSQVTDLATSDLDLGTNKILYSNVYANLVDLPTASSYHGMFAHVHGTGKAYYAHAGSWVELANVSELFDGAYSSLTGAPTNVSSFTNDAGYLTSETTTTLTADSVNQKLVFTDETGTPNDVDLSWAVDDTNLARLTSGTVDANTGIATFTRDDATDFTVDFSALFDDTNLTRITSGTVSGNDLTLTRSDATTVVVDVTSLNGLSNVVEDTTPQLGGNLDGQSFDISTSGSLKVESNGPSGAASVALKASMAGSGEAGDYTLYLPTSVGSNGQVLTTDGAGNLSFTSAVGIQNIVEDTTPQLGGDLDLNNNTIFTAGAGKVKIQAGPATYVSIVNGAGTDRIKFWDYGGIEALGGSHRFGDSTATRGVVNIIGSTQGDAGSGGLRIHSTNLQHVELTVPTTVSANVAFTLPGADGSNGQALTTDGSGNLSFADVSVETDRYAYEDTKTFVVTVDTKDSTHPQFNNGSANGYKIDGAFAPFLHMVPGMTYRFDQSDASNSTHPLAFYYDENKTTSYTDGVTNNGTPGSAGAYTQIIVSDTTPSTLYYQCSVHSLMGWGANISTHNLTGLDTDDLTEGAGNLYYTTSRFNTDFGNKSTSDLSEGTNLYHTTERARTSINATGDISYNSTTGTISFNNSSGYLTSETYSTASELLTAIKTVDGASSGLEADLLDGQEGSYYLNYSNLSNTPTSILNFGITDGTAGQVLQTDGSGNFSFTTVSGGGGGGVGYTGFEDYFFNVSSQTSTFGTSSGAHDKVQVFVNGAYLDDSDFTFNANTGIVSLTTAAENGDEVSVWGFNSTGLTNHELFTVDGSGNITAPGTIQIGNHRKEGSLTSTIASTSPTNVVMYASADYVGSKLIVTVTDTVTGDTQITEALILTVNGGTPKITTYGTMYTSANALASFDVANVSTNTALEVTMASSNSSTVKVAYTLIDA